MLIVRIFLDLTQLFEKIVVFLNRQPGDVKIYSDETGRNKIINMIVGYILDL